MSIKIVNKEQAVFLILRFLVASDNNTKDAIVRESLVQVAFCVLKEMIYETVKQIPCMSTSDIDRKLKIDESIGGHQKWVAHSILNLFEDENRVNSKKVGKERQWSAVE